jgi:hypothetical protein
MVANVKSRKSRRSRSQILHKPGGVIHPRVQAVGPQHFAILCVDCAKNRSKTLLADFYGRVLFQPTTVEHDRPGFQAAIKQVRDAQARHNIKDMIVVVERTGRYHRPIQHAFANAGFEVRVTSTTRVPLWERDMCDSSFPEASELGHAVLAAREQVATVRWIFLDSYRTIGDSMVNPRTVDFQNIGQLRGCIRKRHLAAPDPLEVRYDSESLFEFKHDLSGKRTTPTRHEALSVEGRGDVVCALAFIRQLAHSLDYALLGVAIAKGMDGNSHARLRHRSAAPHDADLCNAVDVAQQVHVVHKRAQQLLLRLGRESGP